MKLQLQKEAKERLDLGMYLMVREGPLQRSGIATTGDHT